MRIIQEPVNFEQEAWDYISIGYYNGKAILKDESENLYYLECEEKDAPAGFAVTADEAVPIEDLPQEEQEQIRNIYR